MKTITTLFLFLALVSNIGFAQRNQERIMSLKITHLSNALELTPPEAAAFWPIYNKYDAEIKVVEKEMRSDFRGNRADEILETVSEEDAAHILEKRLARQQAILKLKTERVNELKKVISAKKLLKLQKAEREFRKSLLKEYRKRRING